MANLNIMELRECLIIINTKKQKKTKKHNKENYSKLSFHCKCMYSEIKEFSCTLSVSLSLLYRI